MNDKFSHKGLFIRVILFLLWFGVLFFLVDGLGFFPILEKRLGYALTELLLWILVLIPFIYVARYTWGYFHRKGNNRQSRR